MLSKITIFLLFIISISNIAIVFSGEVSTQGQGKNESTSMPAEGTDALLEELRWLHAESIITIATKRAMPINKAPGIATVITAKQIKQMGFRTLTDVLKIVPGFDISLANTGEKEIGMRGILDANSQKVKVLIDGHSINDVWQGGISWNFDDLVVENAKRIEVIRGPGSALYGQNAFLAVINIITKDIEDINGFQWTGRYDTFDTQNYRADA